MNLQHLKTLARIVQHHLRHHREVGVYQPPEPESILLRSQRQIESQRAQLKERQGAERAARAARKAPAAAPVPAAAPAEGSPRLFVTQQAAQSEVNLEVDSGLVSDWLTEGKDVLFMDVREVVEMNDGHLVGALLMPMGELARRGAEIPRDRCVVVYCLSGARSLMVANEVRGQGHADIWSMTGGIGSWLAQGGQQHSPPHGDALALCAPARLTADAAARLGREPAPGTLQEIRATDAGTRYTLGLPHPERGFERLPDLTDADLEAL
jgi:rhodanese-related sulfurtransferase